MILTNISTVHHLKDPRINTLMTKAASKFLESEVYAFIKSPSSIERHERNLGNYSLLRRLAWNIYFPFFLKDLKKRIIVFHDPELIFSAFLIKLFGAKVFFDIHEDIFMDIRQKNWIPYLIRNLTIFIITFVFKLILPKIDGLICATPTILNRYSKFHNKCFLIRNFPSISESFISKSRVYKKNEITDQIDLCYVGSLAENRGLKDLISLSNIENISVKVLGSFASLNAKSFFMSSVNSKKIEYYGYVNNDEVYEIIKSCHAGIIFLDDIDNFRESIPTKIFDYTRWGIPSIINLKTKASNLTGIENILIHLEKKQSLDDLFDYLKLEINDKYQKFEGSRNTFLKTYNFESDFRLFLSLI